MITAAVIPLKTDAWVTSSFVRLRRPDDATCRDARRFLPSDMAQEVTSYVPDESCTRAGATVCAEGSSVECRGVFRNLGMIPNGNVWSKTLALRFRNYS